MLAHLMLKSFKIFPDDEGKKKGAQSSASEKRRPNKQSQIINNDIETTINLSNVHYFFLIYTTFHLVAVRT